MGCLRSVVGSCLFILVSSYHCNAWESTFPNGPVAGDQKDLMASVERLGVMRWVESSTEPPHLFRSRTVAYPEHSGTVLGAGWDFVDNVARSGQCVEYQAKTDGAHQSAELRVQEITDKDTLDVTINAEFKGSAKGTIEIIQAGASATTTFNMNRYLSTENVSFVAQGSVTSAVNFAIPSSGSQSVRLRPEMTRLARTDPARFRHMCGDGFVSTIGSGADLYLLFNFHHLTSKERYELRHEIEASAGMGDVFSAKGSSRLGILIEKLSESGRLNIRFIQRGGTIGSLPIDLATAKTKVQALATEEAGGPKPLYVVLTPYSDIDGWIGYHILDTSDAKQRMARYLKRLSSLYFETANIREAYYRPRTTEPGGADSAGHSDKDEYFFSYRHRLRDERFPAVADEIMAEMLKVENVLKKLASPECSTMPASSIEGVPGPRRHRAAIEQLKTADKGCTAAVTDLQVKTKNFDDMRFMVALPPPLNTVMLTEAAVLQDSSKTLDERRNLFTQIVFRHWVERTNQIRCRLFFECLNQKQLEAKYKQIETTLIGGGEIDTFPELVVYTRALCIGEKRERCPRGTLLRNCDFARAHSNPVQVAATQVCEDARAAFRHATKHLNSWGGNNCGYRVDEIKCFNFQPKFGNLVQ